MRMPKQRRQNPKTCRKPVLRYTPWAWAKLVYLRDLGNTEIGGFGITPADDLLLVEDVVLVPQRCSAITVVFDDDAVADYFDQQIDLGRKPEQFARVWVHSHPGSSARPSQTDEATFRRVFGRCDWAVMAILARGGQTYARLRFSTGPGASLAIGNRVDYRRPFAASDFDQWAAEYEACVQPEAPADWLSGLGEDRLEAFLNATAGSACSGSRSSTASCRRRRAP